MQQPSRAQLMAWLSDVPDPEIPVLSITDLGIVRDVAVGERIVVTLAPTYIGCPATEAIENSVREKLREHGVEEFDISRVLSPPWTTEWISDAGRAKLRAYGIAPPQHATGKRTLLGPENAVPCPRCASLNTRQVSEFGSTACKASYQCNSCLEPFEYFKCI